VAVNLFRVYRSLIVPGYNPTRRNRNIGTANSGRGQNNKLTIPETSHGYRAFWEKIGGAQEVTRLISNRSLTFFIQPTREDCVHACTVDDIAHLISHVPSNDWEGLQAVVLRQPRRKEQTLASVWGRLSYAADLADDRGRNVYAGPVLIIEAINPTEPIRFGKSLGPDGIAEWDRLKADGHRVRPRDRYHTLEPTLESCRATQLYRTLLHELGHWVDFLEKVERPSAHSVDSEDYAARLERFHGRASREKEQFANSYAKSLWKNLLATKVVPFDRQLDREQILRDALRWEDFMPVEKHP
jgi:hypothetical protein